MVVATLVLAAVLAHGPAQPAAFPSVNAPLMAQQAVIASSEISSDQLYHEVAKKPKKKRTAAKKPAPAKLS